jgi:hypothetical protein
VLAADTPATTAAGHAFIAPTGWTLRTAGPAMILDAPEAGSRIALIDVAAADADAAVRSGWTTYLAGTTPRQLRSMTRDRDHDGWQDRRTYVYEASPNERRTVTAQTMRSGARWVVAIADLANAVADKRRSQVWMIFEEILHADRALGAARLRVHRGLRFRAAFPRVPDHRELSIGLPFTVRILPEADHAMFRSPPAGSIWPRLDPDTSPPRCSGSSRPRGQILFPLHRDAGSPRAIQATVSTRSLRSAMK